MRVANRSLLVHTHRRWQLIRNGIYSAQGRNMGTIGATQARMHSARLPGAASLRLHSSSVFKPLRRKLYLLVSVLKCRCLLEQAPASLLLGLPDTSQPSTSVIRRGPGGIGVLMQRLASPSGRLAAPHPGRACAQSSSFAVTAPPQQLNQRRRRDVMPYSAIPCMPIGGCSGCVAFSAQNSHQLRYAAGGDARSRSTHQHP